MQTWSVGVLCYNEAQTLERVVSDAREILKQITTTFEIIIVDDCSTDGSRQVAVALDDKYPEVRLVLHDVNKGIGGALRSIYANATYENVGIVPGDGQFDMTEYFPYAEIPSGHFVSYYRKENTSYNLLRNSLSLFNKKLNKLFVGISLKDVNWTKVYKKEDLDQLDLQLTSSLVESEICAKLIFLGKKAIEVQSKYLPRTYGESKGASFAIVKKAMNDIWKLVWIMSAFKRDRKKQV